MEPQADCAAFSDNQGLGVQPPSRVRGPGRRGGSASIGPIVNRTFVCKVTELASGEKTQETSLLDKVAGTGCPKKDHLRGQEGRTARAGEQCSISGEQSQERHPSLPPIALHKRRLRFSRTHRCSKGRDSGSKNTPTNNQFIFSPHGMIPADPGETAIMAPAHLRVTQVKLNSLHKWAQDPHAVCSRRPTGSHPPGFPQ